MGCKCLLLTIALQLLYVLECHCYTFFHLPTLDLNGFAIAAGLVFCCSSCFFGATASGASDFAGALLEPPVGSFDVLFCYSATFFQLQLLVRYLHLFAGKLTNRWLYQIRLLGSALQRHFLNLMFPLFSFGAFQLMAHS